ncbi:MAG: acetyl-CoA carboxylase biotin carboxylase subunit [Deltaproteobacteria bacterium]|nr:MAG: acetyl-CoA carboxylase biotin carboxylase subunit [Deltaproteobacteria bacterium]
MFQKVLIANRGEIAIRVMRTLREMGIATVAVYSDADRRAAHTRYADEAWHIGGSASNESYLLVDRILDVAEKSGAQAIHPGYGFLSENTTLANACAQRGIAFIGPEPHAIIEMGEKTRARNLMIQAGVPVVPGTEGAIDTAEEALEFARDIGFPVLIKAAAGGGGKGMRRVDDPNDFVDAFNGARREALSAFGNGDCYVEKWILQPKHVEFQILCDTHGNAIHLFERECSVQRRHQKVVEETPCPVLLPETRQRMGEVAVRAARAVDYVGAGTVEFLLDVHQDFYFLEMNTRLQVEHPITEMVTGVDLVAEQIRIAAGLPMSVRQDDLRQTGHAIEVRVYAEDPDNNFMPAPGPITRLRVPQGPGTRDDSGFHEGDTVSLFYDPMLSKFIVHGHDREHARMRMLRALDEYVVHGTETNIDFLRDCLREPSFVDGSYDTGVIDAIRTLRDNRPPIDDEDHLDALLAAAMAFHFQQGRTSAATTDPATNREDDSAWRLFGRRQQLGRLS